MTNPRSSKAEDSSEGTAKKGFFKKILNKVSTKKLPKIESTNHRTSSSINSYKSTDVDQKKFSSISTYKAP